LLKYQHPIFSRIGKALSLLELRRNYSKDRLTTSPFTTCINPGSLWGLNGDFWLGFFREAIRVNLWLPVNLYPPAQKDLAIKSNESTDMLIGRLDADLVSIAGGIQEFSTAGMMAAALAECVAAALADGLPTLIVCPGAALQLAGAAILAGQAVGTGAIAVADGGVIVSMLRGRNGVGGGGSDRISANEWKAINKTLERIRAGGPFSSSQDGIIFENREGQLPD
jgi:hypothetical protein